MIGAVVTGVGAALPSGTLANDRLAAMLGVSEEWIFERSGIRSRRIVAGGETTTSLAMEASAGALDAAGVAPGAVDMVIVATVTPDQQLPAVASLLQARLGCSEAGAFDVNAGCSGFLYALAQADALVSSGAASTVLVCGADVLSRITDYADAGTAILFGDGAGAVVVQETSDAGTFGSFLLRSDGSRPELLCVPPGERFVSMRGREVFRRAVEGMTTTLREVLDRNALSLDDLDLVVVHQANKRIVDAVVDRLGLDPAKAFVNIETVGNTSAASIPLALADAASSGHLKPNGLVALAAFGAGFTWGAGLLRWDPLRGAAAPRHRSHRRGLPALVGTMTLLETT